MTMRLASRPARVCRFEAREKQIVASALMCAEPEPADPGSGEAGEPAEGVGEPCPGAGVVPGAGVAAAAAAEAEGFAFDCSFVIRLPRSDIGERTMRVDISYDKGFYREPRGAASLRRRAPPASRQKLSLSPTQGRDSGTGQ